MASLFVRDTVTPDGRTLFISSEGGPLAAYPAVQGSSRALRNAYGILMRRLGPGQAEQERQAFFDHHCALDSL